MALKDKLTKKSKETKEIYVKEEGVERGEKLREECPIESHATFEPAEDRKDPIELLKNQEKLRVAELLPIRHERMSASAFTFYRGAALLMASDLAAYTPQTGIKVQACGDAHISNFGLFSSPERRTVFDINDFDETNPGPWEWDIKRLAASVEICGRDNGFSKKERKAAVRACVEAYRTSMTKFAEMGNLDVWYAHLDIDALSDKLIAASAKAEKLLKKAKGKNSARAVQKLTETKDGKLQIVSNPPFVIPMRDLVNHESFTSSPLGKRISSAFNEERLDDMMCAILEKYKETLEPTTRRILDNYVPVDFGYKLVGVGSVGTRAYFMVLRGAKEDDALVLQIKEAQESVLERYCGKSVFRQKGHRVVAGQRAMQTASDILLGWCRLPGVDGKQKDYYVRQLWDGKGSIDLSLLNPKQLTKLAAACGWTLAHAHARTGDRFAIAAYMGQDDAFDKALTKFASAYADQNEADYAKFMEALEKGEIE